MKKNLFFIFISSLFLTHVNAININQQLDELKNNTCILEEKIQSLESQILNKTHPIGSIYITAKYSSTSEVTEAIGGTWERYGNGKTLVGVDENIAEFNTINKTGGNSTNTLTTSILPSHNHSIPSLTGNTELAGAHTHSFLFGENKPVSLSYNSGNIETLNISNFEWANSHIYSTDNFKTTSTGEHTHNITTTKNTTGTIGTGTPFTNLQPYITVYIYKRIS